MPARKMIPFMALFLPAAAGTITPTPTTNQRFLQYGQRRLQDPAEKLYGFTADDVGILWYLCCFVRA